MSKVLRSVQDFINYFRADVSTTTALIISLTVSLIVYLLFATPVKRLFLR